VTRNVAVSAVVAVIMAGFVLVYLSLVPPPAARPGGMGMSPQGGMAGQPAAGPAIPPVKGYMEGQEIRFLHTEASDPELAEMLTQMMGSPVLVVPSLGNAPDTMLANVYVFTNGVKGQGPLGFQPDVFDHPPGTPGYSPLRRVVQVTWREERSARELQSAAQVQEAEANGEVTMKRLGAVVNMPMVTWPGGQR
jgi:hypothetical protein